MIKIFKNIGWLSFNRSTIAKFGGKRPGYQKPEFGFTLLEVMVSVAIMSIVLVSIYRLHSQSLTMNAEARFYTQAPMLAQSKLAEMGAGKDAGFTDGSGEFDENFPGYTWRVSVEDVEIEALGEISQDLKKIDVTVSFNENEYVYNLRTFRLVREE